MPSSSNSIIAGAGCGFVASVATCPLDVIKTKLQAQQAIRRQKGYEGIVGERGVLPGYPFLIHAKNIFDSYTIRLFIFLVIIRHLVHVQRSYNYTVMVTRHCQNDPQT